MKKVNTKENNGFTLIEILAVIAILAIVVIIALPKVLKYYQNAQRDAFKVEANNILESVKEGYASSIIKGDIEETQYIFINSEERKTGNVNIYLSGQKIKNGEINISLTGQISFIISNGKYCATKDFESNEIIIEKKLREECIELKAIQICAGYSHNVFLLNDGSVRSVGDNYRGALGDGTTTDKNYLVKVRKNSVTGDFLNNVRQISNDSSEHSVFLLNDGSVYSAGNNFAGQLGDGTTTNKNYSVQVKKNSEGDNLINVKQLGTGKDHTIFILNDDTVWAMGNNYYGQLGDGTKVNKSYPVQVKKNSSEYLTNVKEISAGDTHTVFLLNDGTVRATGGNWYGQLGNGANSDCAYPVQVKKSSSEYLTNVKEISAGRYYTVFLLNDGSVWSVGNNFAGQLGEVVGVNYPVQIKKSSAEGDYLTNVKQISGGSSYMVFMLNDGTVWAVGKNERGQLGDGTTIDRVYPVRVKKSSVEGNYLTNVKEISTGDKNTLFLLNDGSVWAVGVNFDGELGDGTTIDKYYPIEVVFN